MKRSIAKPLGLAVLALVIIGAAAGVYLSSTDSGADLQGKFGSTIVKDKTLTESPLADIAAMLKTCNGSLSESDLANDTKKIAFLSFIEDELATPTYNCDYTFTVYVTASRGVNVTCSLDEMDINGSNTVFCWDDESGKDLSFGGPSSGDLATLSYKAEDSNETINISTDKVSVNLTPGL